MTLWLTTEHVSRRTNSVWAQRICTPNHYTSVILEDCDSLQFSHKSLSSVAVGLSVCLKGAGLGWGQGSSRSLKLIHTIDREILLNRQWMLSGKHEIPRTVQCSSLIVMENMRHVGPWIEWMRVQYVCMHVRVNEWIYCAHVFERVWARATVQSVLLSFHRGFGKQGFQCQGKKQNLFMCEAFN